MHKALFYIDWKYSINLDYEMDDNILKKVKSNNQIIKDSFYDDGSDNLEHMFKYLVPCLQDVVIPITRELKILMVKFLILNEGELFTGDIRSRLTYI
jgi:hypothetical protein